MKFSTASAVTLVVLLSAALVGCSAPKPHKPPKDGGTYGTVAALEKAFTKAGGGCEVFKDAPTESSAAETAKCVGTDLTLSTYATAGDRADAVYAFQHPAGGFSFNTLGDEILAGRNWTIESESKSETEGLEPKLGGTIVRIPKQ